MKKINQQIQATLKREYSLPKLKKVGSLSNITLKTGSTSDSTLPRVI